MSSLVARTEESEIVRSVIGNEHSDQFNGSQFTIDRCADINAGSFKSKGILYNEGSYVVDGTKM
jgi:hypothetical protein